MRLDVPTRSQRHKATSASNQVVLTKATAASRPRTENPRKSPATLQVEKLSPTCALIEEETNVLATGAS